MKQLFHGRKSGQAFIFKINAVAGTSYTLPLVGGLTYDCTVEWETGVTKKIVSANDANRIYSYASSGIKTIKIKGTCQGFGFYHSNTYTGTFPLRTAMTEIVQWGTSCDFSKLDFRGCTSLSKVPVGAITAVSNISSIIGFYYGCTNLTCEIDDQWFINCGTATAAIGIFGFSGLTGGSDGFIPEDIFKPLVNIAAGGFWSAFQSMPNMEDVEIPSGLFQYNTKVTSSAFRDCFNGTKFGGSIPEGLFDNNTLVSSDGFRQTFLNCTKLTGSIPTGLFDNNTEVTTMGFASTFGGCSGLTGSIPNGLFDYNTKVSTYGFDSTFFNCSGLTGSIPDGLFDYNTKVSVGGFRSTFWNCSGLTGSIPTDLFRYNILVSTDAFQATFSGCSSLTGAIPTDLFRYNTAVSGGGFGATFSRCSGITSITTDLFRYNTLVSNYAFDSTFLSCTGITSIPTDLFRYNTLVGAVGFAQTFSMCTGITSIPGDLFRYNTAVSVNGFRGTFSGSGITSIPGDLFRYNTAVSSYGFFTAFHNCVYLESVPADLFRYNTAVSDGAFYKTFYGCVKLNLNRNIFFADGEESTRFLNKNISFESCFYRASFTGTQGEAPRLWNCDFGSGIPTKTDCYDGAGNSGTSLSNYADIPSAWR